MSEVVAKVGSHTVLVLALLEEAHISALPGRMGQAVSSFVVDITATELAKAVVLASLEAS